jgi:hypothetical protein
VTYLEEHDGDLSFATDVWTSPNHKVFIAVTVHFKKDGEPMCILLDLVEVAESHSSVNLAVAFAKVLDDFGISKKVSNLCTLIIRKQINSLILPHPSVSASPVTTCLPTIP